MEEGGAREATRLQDPPLGAARWERAERGAGPGTSSGLGGRAGGGGGGVGELGEGEGKMWGQPGSMWTIKKCKQSGGECWL